MSFGARLTLFLFFSFGLIFVWMALGPITREITVNVLNKIGQKDAAAYVDSA